MNRKLQLFLLQLVCHIGLVWAFFNFGVTDWLISFFVYFLSSCLGGTIIYHRYYSHKSFKFKHDWVRKLFVLFGNWSASGDTISWVNNHRQHHRLTDKSGDPHSPHVLGFVRVQWFSMFDSYTNLRFVPDMIRDKFLLSIHLNYFKFHWTIMILLCLLNFKLAAIIYLVPAALVWNMGSFINTVNHSLGYRTYNTTDSSTNFPPLGLLVWGEGWHNNHHANPANANFGEKWWEVDIGYQIIKLVRA